MEWEASPVLTVDGEKLADPVAPGRGAGCLSELVDPAAITGLRLAALRGRSLLGAHGVGRRPVLGCIPSFWSGSRTEYGWGWG